jgi:hypothetical protein
MRSKFLLLGITVGAIFLAMSATEVQAQRFGFGIGLGGGGRGGIGRGVWGGNNRNNGNSGYYNQPSTPNYVQPNYVQPNYVQPQSAQPQYPAALPYQGPGVTIRNPSDQTLNFAIGESRQMQIKPGETLLLSEKAQYQIAFDRGGQFGSARYSIREGVYDFTSTERGWELYRQRADATATNGNLVVPPPTQPLPAQNGAQPPAVVSPPAENSALRALSGE